uniref:Uncharacterized protein n=1 Tax=Parascaris equorum TaxID=6256 RepID=A0A914S385_PAREQ
MQIMSTIKNVAVYFFLLLLLNVKALSGYHDYCKCMKCSM